MSTLNLRCSTEHDKPYTQQSDNRKKFKARGLDVKLVLLTDEILFGYFLRTTQKSPPQDA